MPFNLICLFATNIFFAFKVRILFEIIGGYFKDNRKFYLYKRKCVLKIFAKIPLDNCAKLRYNNTYMFVCLVTLSKMNIRVIKCNEETENLAFKFGRLQKR